MSISFWKMSPSIVYLGGREEAEWLDKYLPAGQACGQSATVHVSDMALESAREQAIEMDKTKKAKALSEAMFKKLEDMLADHKKTQMLRRLANPDDAVGDEWFEISVCW